MDDDNVNQSQSEKERGPAIDLEKMTEVLQPETSSAGGLLVPSKDKDRVVFRHPERESLLGLDVLANVKRAESQLEGQFKVPKERIASYLTSLDEEGEKSSTTGLEEVGSGVSSSDRNQISRRYRDPTSRKASDLDSGITEGVRDTPGRSNSDDHKRYEGGGGNQPPTIEHGSLSKSEKKQSWCELIPMTISSWSDNAEEDQISWQLIPMTISSWSDDEEEF